MSHRTAARARAFTVVSMLVAGCGASENPGDPTPSGDVATSELGPAAAAVAVGVVASPRPAPTTDERRHLVYELILVNLDPTQAVRITRIDVSDGDRATTLASLHDDGLVDRFADFSTGEPNDGSAGPGGAVVAFIDLPIARAGRMPADLAHRIAVDRGGHVTRIKGPAVAVADSGALPIGPPLRGGNLIDISGCCNGPHTRGFFVTTTNVFVSQRFAIDFERVDDQGTFVGDPTRNESYFLFGADVIAAESGRIVEVRDGLPENVPSELPPFDIDSATGNHVVEALDDGRFVLYAHLATGSVRVQPGQRVRRGQVLAQVGNTGHSDEPHLHFQVTDGPAAFASNGLPYVFDLFRFQATVDLDADQPIATPVPSPQERRRRLPMTGDIVTFP